MFLLKMKMIIKQIFDLIFLKIKNENDYQMHFCFSFFKKLKN